MGKKKSRNTPKKSHPITNSRPYSMNSPPVEVDQIALELDQNNQEPLAIDPKTGGMLKIPSAMNIDYDEFDEGNDVYVEPEDDSPKKMVQKEKPPKHAYQTVFMSHENITSPDQTKISMSRSRTNSISNKSNPAGSNSNLAGAISRSRSSIHQHAFDAASSDLFTARSRSRSSLYNNKPDGGAYEDFHASRHSINKSHLDHDAAGDSAAPIPASRSVSHRSLFSDAAEERSLAGFPRSSFGGSRASINNSQLGISFGNEPVQIVRGHELGELERLDYNGGSRSNSQASGRFGNKDDVLNDGFVANSGRNEVFIPKELKPRLPRSRTVSESSKKSGTVDRDMHLHSISQQINDNSNLSEGVRTYHADSDYLQNRLSKLSIHTNNDEFVLVGGHPPTFSEEKLPSTRGNDETYKSGIGQDESAFSNVSDYYEKRQYAPVSSRSNSSQFISRADSRNEVGNLNTRSRFAKSQENQSADEILGKSISQQSFRSDVSSMNDMPVSRASSRHTIGTSSNTDDRLLLAARHCKSPEAEGLMVLSSDSRNNLSTHTSTLLPLARSQSRSSVLSRASGKGVEISGIPTLYSHPDDKFGDDDEPGIPYRPTKEHQHTPSNVQTNKKSIRDSEQYQNVSISAHSSSENIQSKQPPKPLLITSCLTPMAPKRSVSAFHHSEEDLVQQTPITVQRVSESRQLRPVQSNTKKTSEIAIQTGDTIRLRQSKWNTDVLSELADVRANYDITTTKSTSYVPSPNRPKANNSFERNGHPAAAVLNNMLQNRKESRGAVASDSEGEVRTSRSNSSHQVTILQSPTTAFKERMRCISNRYRCDENTKPGDEYDLNGNTMQLTNDQFVNGLTADSTSTPSKYTMFKRDSEMRDNESLEVDTDETDAIGWVPVLSGSGNNHRKTNNNIPTAVDAKWVEGKRTNGDTIRQHVPKGRIRDLANVFDNIANSPGNNALQSSPIVPKKHVSMIPVRINSTNGSNVQRKEDRFQSSSDVRSRTSSNRLDGSSLSSNAFLHSTQTIPSQDDRHRSTSSSSHQPHVFTRNTFLRTSSVKPSEKQLPDSVPMTTTYSNINRMTAGKGDGFVSQFESIPSMHNSVQQLPKSQSTYKMPRRSSSISPMTKMNEVEEDGAVRASHGQNIPVVKISGSYDIPVVQPSRNDMFRRSMPGREPIRRETPILRSQTTVSPPLPLSNDFRYGSIVEIPKNQDSKKIEVPIQKTFQSITDISKNIEIPIDRVPRSGNLKKKLNPTIRIERAKTQEVPGVHYEQPKYESRAISGEMGNANEILPKKSFFTSRDAFGRTTAEDLSGKKDEGVIRPSWIPQQHEWKTTTTTTTFSSQQYLGKPNKTNMFEERKRIREEEERLEKERELKMRSEKMSDPLTRKTYSYTKQLVNDSGPLNHNMFEKHPSQFNVPSNLSRFETSSNQESHHPYSPPATEDAGSRITHNTITTVQDDAASYNRRANTADSSIRGKIDELFQFVNDDSSRKTLHASSTIDSHHSTETMGRNTSGRFEKRKGNDQSFSKYPNYRTKRNMDESGEWERVIYKDPRLPSLRESSISPRRRMIEKQLQSPDRRNTVAGSELDDTHYQNELEYSLSQYREMQKEQLRRRLPSADEPQFFRSPSLSAPYAGQPLHAYRTVDIMGTPTAGEKVRLGSSSSAIRNSPIALATSTPIDSPQSLASYSVRTRLEVNNNNQGNDTFVSSISGVSTADRQADNKRKLCRISYMIENTQKQMDLNEIALVDAIKKGRKSQEIAAHRSILISRELLRLQRAELKRLHSYSAVRRPPPAMSKSLHGTVVFGNLCVRLNEKLCSRLEPKDDGTIAFMAIFKCGHHVEATEVVYLRVRSSDGADDKIMFEKAIQFSDVPVDFNVKIEIYSMQVQPVKQIEQSIGSSLASKCKNLMGPPQRKQPINCETAFRLRGSVILDREAIGERQFLVDDPAYPIEGTIWITTTCSRLPDAFEVDFRGFLTIFSTITGMASWDRFWAVLRRGVVFFWKYPDEEQMGREPRMKIDLTKCTNNSIEKCGFDLCPRPNSFSVEYLVEAEEVTIGSIVEKRRVLMSADTSEMLDQWLNAMNQTLDVIRGPI